MLILSFLYFALLSVCGGAAEGGGDEMEIYFFYDSEPCTCHPGEKAANEIARQSLSQVSKKYHFRLLEYDTEQPDGARLFAKYRVAYGSSLRTPVILIGNDYIIVVSRGRRDEIAGRIIGFIERYKNEGFYPNPSELVNDKADISALNLPLMTILIALVDSFNPCVIFVLLFLLSVLLNLRSRGRVLLVGMIFVLVTGIFYFLFMTAWLKLFSLINLAYMRHIKIALGAVAIIIGVINIKEFFFFKRGLSFTIPEAGKNRLFSKMHNLFSKPTLRSIIPGTIAIALFANLVELPCTGGFPPVYIMLLKDSALQPFRYYIYLLMYDFIYILPELIIVIFTAFTLATKRFTEKHGRILKLISGIVILALGFVLVCA